MTINGKTFYMRQIKGKVETYIGGRKKGVTVNQICGHIKSMLKDNWVTKEGVHLLLQQIQRDIEGNVLYPNTPLSEKRERFQALRTAITPTLE